MRSRTLLSAIYAPADWQDFLFSDAAPDRLRRLLAQLLAVHGPVPAARAAHVHALLGDPAAGVDLLLRTGAHPLVTGQLALCRAARLTQDDVTCILNGPQLVKPVDGVLAIEGQWRLDFALGAVWSGLENVEKMRLHYEHAAHLANLTGCHNVARSARIDLLQHMHTQNPLKARDGLLQLMDEAGREGHETQRGHAARQVANTFVTLGDYQGLHDFAAQYLRGAERDVLCNGALMMLGRPYKLPPLGAWRAHSFELAVHAIHTLIQAREAARLWQVREARALSQQVLDLPEPGVRWPGAVHLLQLARGSALILQGRGWDAQRLMASMPDLGGASAEARLLRAGVTLEALTLPEGADYPAFSGLEALAELASLFMADREDERERGAHLLVKWCPDAAAILSHSPLAVPQVAAALHRYAVILGPAGATYQGARIKGYPRMNTRGGSLVRSLEAALKAETSLSDADYKRLQRHRNALRGILGAHSRVHLQGTRVKVPPVVRLWTIRGALLKVMHRVPDGQKERWTSRLPDPFPIE